MRQLSATGRRNAIAIAHKATRDPRAVGDELRADVHRIADTGAIVLPIVRVSSGRGECQRREEKYSHRADFHDALYRRAIDLGVKVRTGAKVVGYDFDTPYITLEDGSKHTADLVIAAEGRELQIAFSK